jgi:hypothetical protein
MFAGDTLLLMILFAGTIFMNKETIAESLKNIEEETIEE